MSKKSIGILVAAIILLAAAGITLYLVLGGGGPYIGTVTARRCRMSAFRTAETWSRPMKTVLFH